MLSIEGLLQKFSIFFSFLIHSMWSMGISGKRDVASMVVGGIQIKWNVEFLPLALTNYAPAERDDKKPASSAQSWAWTVGINLYAPAGAARNK